jgi:hypothetical protein
MMKLFYVLVTVLLIATYHFFKWLFAKGEIIDAYIINDKSGLSVLLLIDYATTMVSKGGISKSHTFKFKKINLQDLSVEYEEKIISFTSDMLDGFVNVLGMNEQFLFIVSYNYDLIVFDIINGKIICNKKEIIKENPNLTGFDTEHCVYSNNDKSVVIFDGREDAFLLDTNTIKAEQINFDNNHFEKAEIVSTFDDLPSVALNKSYLISDPISFFNDVDNYNIDFIPNKGSKRYSIYIRDYGSDEKVDVSDQTFLGPTLMRSDKNEMPLLTIDIPNILIVHLKNLDPAIKDIYISRIDEKGYEHWRKDIFEITVDAKLSKHSFLYFSELNNEIYFIYAQKSSDRLSVSAIDKHSGKLLHKPKLFVNRRIEYKR